MAGGHMWLADNLYVSKGVTATNADLVEIEANNVVKAGTGMQTLQEVRVALKLTKR